jgi:hypothetical protein
MLKRTPILALIITGILSILVILIFEKDARPFTSGQSILLYFIAFFPSMGIAMLFDPYSRQIKEMYSKINFYIQEEDPADQVARVMEEEQRGQNN